MTPPWIRRKRFTVGPVLAIVACSPVDAPSAEVRTASTAAESPTARMSVGLDSARLAAAYTRAGELPRLRTLLVARHGEIQAERRFRGPSLDAPANTKSVSKSILSALIGIAIAEGHLQGVHQPIAPFFTQHLGPGADPRKQRITVGNLLSMQSGLESTSFGNYGEWVSSPNWTRYAISRAMVDDPGGRMLYSTGSTHLLSAILTRATGQSTLAYARAKLAEPLGIRMRPWPTDPQGIYFGGNEMQFTPREMVRIGELYRNGGVYQGRQIIPAEWIQESWRPRTVSPWNGHRYGYGWWMRDTGQYRVYFAWGYGGQYIFVVPDLELTVVTTSDPDAASRDGGHLRAVHNLIDEWIIPAAEAGAAPNSN